MNELTMTSSGSASSRLLDVLRASGEADLGKAMLRLAQLAAARHRKVAAELAAGGDQFDSPGILTRRVIHEGSQGWLPSAVVAGEFAQPDIMEDVR